MDFHKAEEGKGMDKENCQALPLMELMKMIPSNAVDGRVMESIGRFLSGSSRPP